MTGSQPEAGWSMRGRKPNGFSLIEAVSAVAIYAIVIIATTGAISQHLKLLNTNAGYLRARLAAIREMERLKNLSWANLTNTSVTPTARALDFTTYSPTYPSDFDPQLVQLLPNVQGVAYVCLYHPRLLQASMRQVIVAVRLDNTAPALSTVTCAPPITNPPHPKVIQFTALINQGSPFSP